MSYTVLARRYRSRDFDELVGQGAIADTLQRAVERDRVAHAYLFCGTRGVGKTSLARILARTLNAVDTLGDQTGIADAIMRGDDLDVIEIDGASNRGVEQARELIAAAGLSPARCPYRIYIIDEVHMLTNEAFNTLLKTMEEPPSHVKFILCTTEPHKVPATIRSRCQRFDFKPITTADIAGHLQHVTSTEGVEAQDGVLERVASLGRGSMRDALGVLERLLASGVSPLTMEHVESTLGLPPADLVLSLIDAVLDGNPATALRSAETLVQQGIALDQVIESLIEGFRGLMLQVTCGQDTDLLDWPQAQRQAMGERASRSRADVFAHAIAVFEAVARQSTLSASSRALFDAAIVRLALSSALEEDSPLAKKKIATRPQAAAPRAAAKPAPRAAAKGRVPTGTTSGASSKSFGKSSRKSSPGASSKAAPKAKSKAAAAVSPTATKTSRDRAPRAAPTPVISSSDLTARWADAVEAMGSRPLQAAAALLEPISLERDILRVRAMAGDSGVLNARIDAMRVAIQKTFGEGVQLVLDRPGQQTQATPTGSPDDVAGDSAISMVSEVFDAQVVQVRNLKEGNNVQGT